jgi:acetyl-CoA acetyltransferase
MSRDDYFKAPMLADPHCLYDFCLETDGAVAVIVTSAERAQALKAGFEGVRLGPWVLRARTAAQAAAVFLGMMRR